ncbi:UNVERIFIED_CONTAM: hypothetical protein Sangu_1801700 [Sesamum angustifolium]|uniref:DUF4283 domain-containing protein n=1 Tax=Sesamum angustifolium TaxID=2727405 RepID=A0AAW2MA48_9LAMI
MEAETNRLGRALILTEEEDLGVVMPAGVWHSDPEKVGFYSVGCILSHKPYSREALKTILLSSLNPAKEMEITFLERDRFLLKFFHSIDRDRIIAGGHWAFEKNLTVLAAMTEDENPADVDLSWCEFHVPTSSTAAPTLRPEPFPSVKTCLMDQTLVQASFPLTSQNASLSVSLQPTLAHLHTPVSPISIPNVTPPLVSPLENSASPLSQDTSLISMTLPPIYPSPPISIIDPAPITQPHTLQQPQKRKYTKKIRPLPESTPNPSPSLLTKRKLIDENNQFIALPNPKKQNRTDTPLSEISNLLVEAAPQPHPTL